MTTVPFDWRVLKSVAYVQARYDQLHLTLKTLSSAVRLSERRLGVLIKTQTGKTFHELLREVRLSKAAELLGNEALTIKEVAAAVGYSATSNFDRDFRVRYGASPRQYRMELGPNKNRRTEEICDEVHGILRSRGGHAKVVGTVGDQSGNGKLTEDS